MFTISQTQIAKIAGVNAGDESGKSISLSSNGKILAIGSPKNDDQGNNSGHVRIYEDISGVWTQIGNNINGKAVGDQSGYSVSLSSNGNVVAIGAPLNSDNGMASGHVRIYQNVSGIWTQVGQDIGGEAKDDWSGHSVSLSHNGRIVAIGAPDNDGNGNNSGHVRVYENISGVWNQIGGDIDGEAAGDLSGYNISLSSDGKTIAIGAPRNDGKGIDAGHVRVYENISNVWTQVGADIDGESAGDQSGWSVSLSSDGQTVAVGAPDNSFNGNSSGHVRVYKNISGAWTQIGADIDGDLAGDKSGVSVSLSQDGSILAIGAHLKNGNGGASGSVSIYKNRSNIWKKIGSDIHGTTLGDWSGYSVTLSSDGRIVGIGSPNNDTNGSNSGEVRVYDLTVYVSNNNFVLNNFNIYPNPASSILNIELKSSLILQKVIIYNSLGQIIKTVDKQKIDVADLSSGIYTIEILTDKGKASKKLIIK